MAMLAIQACRLSEMWLDVLSLNNKKEYEEGLYFLTTSFKYYCYWLC